MAEIKFKVGDKVQIRKDSEYYGRNKTNPMNVPGKIVEIESEWDEDDEEEHIINVDWDNGQDNMYRIKDLELSTLPFNH